MGLPDPLTIIIVLGELLIVAYLLVTITWTMGIVERFSRSDPCDPGHCVQFAIYRSKANAYSLIGIPLLFLAIYLAQWGLEGTPTWNSDLEGIIAPGFYIIGAPFFLILLLLPPFYLTNGTAKDFFLVSVKGIERRRGRKIVTSIDWTDVTSFDVSCNGSYPKFVLIRSRDKEIRIEALEKGITNRNRFYEIAMKKVQAERMTPRLIKWAESIHP